LRNISADPSRCLGSPFFRTSAGTVDLGAQSDLIGAPEPMSIEVALAAPNGGSTRVRKEQGRPQKATFSLTPTRPDRVCTERTLFSGEAGRRAYWPVMRVLGRGSLGAGG
jgi:hypothetical protein